MLDADVTQLDFDIVCIDAGYIRPRLACSYLIAHQGRAAFIDCGTTHSVPHMTESLKNIGLSTNDVEYIIPTHVHLDHAGGAGSLMQTCSNATLVAHPKGARHLINPQRLVESARSVYGEKKFDSLYGEILPIEESRVFAAGDKSEISLNGRKLTIADTPGHARHHFCIYDEMSHGWFTGDTFGLSYPDIITDSGQYLMPTTTPTQFEPEAWQKSIDRLLETDPKRMFLTHYGMIEGVEIYAEKLSRDLKAYCELALTVKDEENQVQALCNEITNFTINDLRQMGCMLAEPEIEKLLSMDINLNAQGLEGWLKRLAT
ncbi:MAG: MBL fold metallo-hydrolase [Pseudomonadota bacterium]